MKNDSGKPGMALWMKIVIALLVVVIIGCGIYIWRKSSAESAADDVYTDLAAIAHGQATVQITQAPTDAPTQAPTEAPTDAPTQAPTEILTDAPTQAPTEVLTDAPTQAPTQASTDAPTQVPTETPTQVPAQAIARESTPEATEEPVMTATVQVTDVPTPTLDPAALITMAPTATPNLATFDASTQTPSATLTPNPTEAPTVSVTPPTNVLTAEPDAAGDVEEIDGEYETPVPLDQLDHVEGLTDEELAQAQLEAQQRALDEANTTDNTALLAGVTADPAAAGDNEYVSRINFSALSTINSDVVGWIQGAEDMTIDYPIVQGENNSHYLYYTFDGTYSSVGTIFLDYSNTPDFSDLNSIIYGHHLRSGKMFADLMKYKDQKFVDEHPVMYLYTPTGDYEIQLIAGYVIPLRGGNYGCYQTAYADEEDFLKYIETAKNRSVFTSDVTVEEGDRIITLSTCTYETYDARFVVHGKLVPLPSADLVTEGNEH